MGQYDRPVRRQAVEHDSLSVGVPGAVAVDGGVEIGVGVVAPGLGVVDASPAPPRGCPRPVGFSLSQGPDSIVAMKKLILLAVLVALGAVAAKKVRAS